MVGCIFLFTGKKWGGGGAYNVGQSPVYSIVICCYFWQESSGEEPEKSEEKEAKGEKKKKHKKHKKHSGSKHKHKRSKHKKHKDKDKSPVVSEVFYAFQALGGTKSCYLFCNICFEKS